MFSVALLQFVTINYFQEPPLKKLFHLCFNNKSITSGGFADLVGIEKLKTVGDSAPQHKLWLLEVKSLNDTIRTKQLFWSLLYEHFMIVKVLDA